MIRIVLSDEQIEAISGIEEPIDFVDSQGRKVGRMAPSHSDTTHPFKPSQEDLAQVKQRIAESKASGCSFTTWNEIKSRLQSQEGA